MVTINEICVICGRNLGSNYNEHHLIPKQYSGKHIIKVHIICHNKIHAVFSNSELQHYYHTPERILEHEEMQKFVKWVSKKHVDFYDKNDDTKQRYSKRKNHK